MTKPNSALQAGGDETPVAHTILDVGFKYEGGIHTPTVLVGFAPNDWDARDAFVRSLATRPTPAAAADQHQTPRPFDPGERTHHAALQRIGYALGLLPGADLHEECVPAIEALRAAAAGVPKPSARASYARDITPTEDVDNLARMAWFVGRMSDPDDDTYTPSPGMLEVIGRLNEVFATPVAPAGVPQLDIEQLMAAIRDLPFVNASEIDGEESDGTPRHYRSRRFVSLTKLERLLRSRLGELQ